MQQIYLKRMTKQDITKSVAVCTESVQSFWDISLEATDEYTPIEVCHVSNPSYFPTGITIHKGYGGVKDWRICGENWKKLYANDNAEIGDIMFVRKLGNRCFSVEIIKKNSLNYSFLQSFFSGSDNYVILTTDNSNFQNIFNPPLPLQQIFYGAPGTGKSHTIKRIVEDGNLPHIRTTFHPDSDYSTFVGAYKPTTTQTYHYGLNGSTTIILKHPDGNPIKDSKIEYRFVPQAFLKAYVAAWSNLNEPFFLIIEEINRGNCAQIFGDLFQLLDRNGDGISDYPITSDDDIRRHLNSKFSALDDAQRADIPNEILSGEEMLLPRNLHIWATMNTSDQSLFPIDSAFKRRWDWKYTPIANGNKDWKITADGKEYDWWQFLEKINAQIGNATHSEDKKLGYYFCKPINNQTIDAETFVSKVVFYLWNDVFKDFAEDAGSIFNDEDGSVLSFNKFYTTDADGNAVVVEQKVTQFLQNLGVDPLQDIE